MPTTWSDSPLLLAAYSARALAASAARAGLSCRTLDLFADVDTRTVSERWQKVPDNDNGSFDRAALLAAADRIDPQQRCGVVYGGGFEADPTLLDALCRQRPLLGNPTALLEQLRQPASLTALLARLGIAQPKTRLTPPDNANDGRWLRKRIGGSGGDHVRPLRQSDLDLPCRNTAADCHSDHYYQRRISGRSLSITALSDGRQARLLGVCRQLHAPLANRPYRHAGAVTLTADALPAELHDELRAAATALVESTGLRGLWGFDIIADGRRWWLLEINPRPSMNFSLFETNHSLLRQHLETLRGRLPPAPALANTAVGYLIVYAPHRLNVGCTVWPDWISDRPTNGEQIAAHQPLCTVTAGPAPARELPAQLRQRRQQALRLFDPVVSPSLG